MIFLKRFRSFIATLRSGIRGLIFPVPNRINCLSIGVCVYNCEYGWGKGIICKNEPKEMSLTIKEYPYDTYIEIRIEIKFISQVMSYELRIEYYHESNDNFRKDYTYKCIKRIERLDLSVDIFKRKKKQISTILIS